MVFKQVFRLAFVTLIWKQYKGVILSTLILFGYLFLVSGVHADFLKNAELQKDATNLGVTFVFKWLAFAAGVFVYFLFHLLRGRSKKSQKAEPQKILSAKEAAKQDEDDPFSAIRTRKRLRSRGDFIGGEK